MTTLDRLLSDLVAIDSVNPTLVPGAAGEATVARRIIEELDAIGLAVEVQVVAPSRPNVVGTLRGRAPGRSLMLCGHIDTVGVSGMDAPFDPVLKDGRLYGRGAQDMKGGVAAMIDAVRVVAESGGLDAGEVIVACVVDEEHSSIGADALVTRWRADAGVVTEPTDLDIAICHKGFAWSEIVTTGKAAHGSRPADGIDAIVHMGRVLVELGVLDTSLQAGARHPRLGSASLHASTITGGHELSSYPDRCALQVERRTIPGEPAGAFDREVDAILARLAAADPAFKGVATPLFSRPPYEIDPAHPLPGMLAGTARAAGCRADTIGMSFWTDAAVLGDAGIPSVLFGPTGAGLHSVEEWVDLASVRQCRDALAALIREWCR
ncbi:MAG: M20/M25/M40 family metallo-hydrolase [Vicinamibacterales bacterium]